MARLHKTNYTNDAGLASTTAFDMEMSKMQLDGARAAAARGDRTKANKLRADADSYLDHAIDQNYRK